MKILHVNSSDFRGGAAKAAYRLHRGLLNNGISSEFLTQIKDTDDRTVFTSANSLYDEVYNRVVSKSDIILKKISSVRKGTPYSFNYLGHKNIKIFFANDNDIVHLHWINSNFISLYDLNYAKKIVWTLHDSWPFTGGCHIPYECNKYETKCSQCPILAKGHLSFLAEKTFQLKKKIYKNIPLSVVAPSRWLHDCAKKSLLFYDKDIYIIPNGIDTTIYRNVDKKIARKLLNLDNNKKYILFGAVNSTTDANKGYNILLEVIARLKSFVTNELDEIEIIVFGGNEPENNSRFGYKTHYLGKIYDDVTLSLIYSASDVVLVPSKSENLPNIVMEAMSCATPVVAFSIGGIPDLIDSKENGFLAIPFDTNDFAKGIAYVLEDVDKMKKMSKKAREKIVNSFDINIISRKYINLYKEKL